MADDTKPINPPIKMDLGDNPGEIEFKTFEEARDWGQKEFVWSEEWFRKRGGFESFNTMQSFQEESAAGIRDAANQAISGDLSPEEAASKIKLHLTSYQNHEKIHRESPHGKLCEKLSSRMPFSANGALAAYTGHPFAEHIDNFNAQQLQEFTAGYVFMQSNFPETKKSEALGIRHELNKLQGEYVSKLSEQVTNFQNAYKETQKNTKDLEEQVKKHNSAFDALNQAYDAHMKLESPAKYWNENATENKKRVLKFSKAFAVLAIAGIVITTLFGPDLLEKVKGSGFVAVAVFSIPALAFFSLLALLGKAILSWLNSMSDAEERHVMTKTFIAFLSDDKAPVDEAHKKIILDRLFESSRGTKSEGSANPTIDLIRELREILKKSEGD